MMIFDFLVPLPIITESASATRLSIRIGQSSGRPIGVIASYSISVCVTAFSIDANETLRASSRADEVSETLAPTLAIKPTVGGSAHRSRSFKYYRQPDNAAV